ncbi:MAG: hypothetical protein ACI8Z7_000661 [Candidatus Nanohaloarchaea archaeon]|jgi:hypothetical protein
MRLVHTAVIAIGLLFMVSGATAVVGGPEPDDGEMAIMGQGTSASASASTSVNENGTEWRAETSMVNRSSNITEGRLEGIQYSEEDYKVEFTGYIQAPTPCHVIEHSVEESGDSYTLNVETIHDETDEESNESIQPCAQVMTMIEYDGSFSAQEDFSLEVRHNNETVDTLEHPGLEQTEPVEEPRTGFIQSLRNFFSGLF